MTSHTYLTVDHTHSEDEHCIHVVRQQEGYRYQCSCGSVGRWYLFRGPAGRSASSHAEVWSSNDHPARIVWS